MTTTTSDEWRICPVGQHYIRSHKLHIPPSKTNPQGKIVIRKAHCAKSSSSHDTLSYDELQWIAQSHFSDLTGPPTANALKKFEHADEFDVCIRGWTHYWNTVFSPTEPLDPNMVKALIASESSFKAAQRTPTKNSKLGDACGLMQLTNGTLKIMRSHKGELKDHFITLSDDEIFDPPANICAGVRWLFRKKITAAARLKHPATWEQAIAEYKGILKGIIENKNPDPLGEMPIFRGLYQQLLDASLERACDLHAVF